MTLRSSPLIVAIDGPSGAGKSTVAKLIAGKLGLHYVDTGALYRMIGLVALESHALENIEALEALLQHMNIEVNKFEDGTVQFLVNGRDLSGSIRSPQVAEAASKVSALPIVRKHLLRFQQELAHRLPGAVLEGRDIGTVVCPDAQVKIFLDASIEERARRRFQQFSHEEQAKTSLEETRKALHERDMRDASRTHAPLKPAMNAIILDCSTLTIDEVIQAILQYIP